MLIYKKDALRSLGFPAKFLNEIAVSHTVTVGQHAASGARVYANAYAAWSLARAIAWDQATLDSFTTRGFDMTKVPGLREEIHRAAMERSLCFEGTQYSYA